MGTKVGSTRLVVAFGRLSGCPHSWRLGPIGPPAAIYNIIEYNIILHNTTTYYNIVYNIT